MTPNRTMRLFAAAMAMAVTATALNGTINTGSIHLGDPGRTDGVRPIFADTPNIRLDNFDVIVGFDTVNPNIHLIFSADSMFEGATYALDAMDARDIKASFFFTGNFLRDTIHAPVIRRIIDEGHYVGPHSDRHILLADWNRGRSSLVTPDSLINDIRANIIELKRYGITADSITFALPPFEWCNREQAHVYRSLGILPVNPTPELETYRDYTTPDMREYRTSREMLDQLFDYELTHNLNGALIILHLGTQDVRTDKLYHHLPTILDTLSSRGYTFRSLPRK